MGHSAGVFTSIPLPTHLQLPPLLPTTLPILPLLPQPLHFPSFPQTFHLHLYFLFPPTFHISFSSSHQPFTCSASSHKPSTFSSSRKPSTFSSSHRSSTFSSPHRSSTSLPLLTHLCRPIQPPPIIFATLFTPSQSTGSLTSFSSLLSIRSGVLFGLSFSPIHGTGLCTITGLALSHKPATVHFWAFPSIIHPFFIHHHSGALRGSNLANITSRNQYLTSILNRPMAMPFKMPATAGDPIQHAGKNQRPKHRFPAVVVDDWSDEEDDAGNAGGGVLLRDFEEHNFAAHSTTPMGKTSSNTGGSATHPRQGHVGLTFGTSGPSGRRNTIAPIGTGRYSTSIANANGGNGATATLNAAVDGKVRSCPVNLFPE